jgi:hypothetical protein
MRGFRRLWRTIGSLKITDRMIGARARAIKRTEGTRLENLRITHCKLGQIELLSLKQVQKQRALLSAGSSVTSSDAKLSNVTKFHKYATLAGKKGAEVRANMNCKNQCKNLSAKPERE